MPTPARKPRSLAEECADDLARLAQPVVKPRPGAGGTGRLADVIGVAAAADHFERDAANKRILYAYARRHWR